MPLRSALALLFAGALALGGCTTADGVDGLYVTELVPTSTSLPVANAWATLPVDAGRVVLVVETTEPRSNRQRIVLIGDGAQAGENVIMVERGGSEGVRAELLRPPSVEMLSGEIVKLENGASYRIASGTQANRAGPFGYAAVSAAGGGSCVYAWQWLDEREIDGASGTGFGRSRPVSIRVRLCRKLSVDDLVASLRDLTLSFGHADESQATAVGGAETARDALGAAASRMGTSAAVVPALIDTSRSFPDASARSVAQIDPPRPRPSRGHGAPKTASKAKPTASLVRKPAAPEGSAPDAADAPDAVSSPHIPNPTEL